MLVDLYAGIVLNGGQSKRMGQAKSELMVAGLSLLDRTQLCMQKAGIQKVFISGSAEGQIADIYQNLGPLAGVQAVLEYLKLTSYQHVVVMPVDMPLVQPSDIKKLIQQAAHQQTSLYYASSIMPFIVYNFKFQTEPLTHLLKQAEASSSRGPSFKQFLQQISAREIQADNPKHLLNVNTPEAFAQIEQMNGEIL
ncbi:molybdenum cofactor guanylyltransferase [Gayadomonas joobiniege]|uniref:molybdenum cofactor guanylyltransferase n=1 Tax=Gayadomonas joobiniege TaxID=1234606 RepID=UPI0003779E88|nr:molybdenum cofactor guanylyltransferase [Gayadomonas joobiniege]